MAYDTEISQWVKAMLLPLNYFHDVKREHVGKSSKVTAPFTEMFPFC
jgi:hypothetical protein